MIVIAALIYCGLTALVVGVHLCLILGAPWGQVTMGGRWPGALPLQGRLASALSMVVLSLMAMVIAGQGGLLAFSAPRWALWAILAYLALAVVLHILTPSPLERKLWLPVILAMTLAAVRVVFA